MHDLVRSTARKIASEQLHVFTHQKTTVRVEEWPRTDELQKVTWFGSENPTHIFEGMKQLEVLDFSNMQLPSLPLSLQCLANLRTLCLDGCKLGDIVIIAKLKKLEILSLIDSDIEQLPREIAQLTHLRLFDLKDSSKLKVIPPDVISSLFRLEDLCMENSFTQWEGEGKSNACLAELKHLSHLTSLDIQIPDAKLLPKDIVFENLVRYRIFVGNVWSWKEIFKANSTLKLNKFDTSLHLVDGISKLLKRTEDLHLRELDSIYCELDGSDFITWCLSVMETLSLNQLINLQERPVRLEEIKVTRCKSMVEIVSQGRKEIKEDAVNVPLFPELRSLTLEDLPKLSNFCYEENPVLSKPAAQLGSHVTGDKGWPTSAFLGRQPPLDHVFDLEGLNVDDGHVGLLPKLGVLQLIGLPKLRHICNCGSSRNHFPSSMASAPVGNIIFPKLFHILLDSLPNLTSFVSPGYHSLQRLHHADLDTPSGAL
ncbi:putative disease resistance protein [Vitis vinifera]|uniref:Putative disease resistance protein n=1 Tax=Vitis vinifera TaxID=29760 RepID=A0A438GEQ8_VITVI|nr:putative disease resistance protein [Vitis vinifera]